MIKNIFARISNTKNNNKRHIFKKNGMIASVNAENQPVKKYAINSNNLVNERQIRTLKHIKYIHCINDKMDLSKI